MKISIDLPLFGSTDFDRVRDGERVRLFISCKFYYRLKNNIQNRIINLFTLALFSR